MQVDWQIDSDLCLSKSVNHQNHYEAFQSINHIKTTVCSLIYLFQESCKVANQK